MNDPFERLAPFIQEYIYNQHWEELRDIQAEAIMTILDSPSHVLISSGTASGKTEAALFPVLTALHNCKLNSFGAIYIGPLNALINDQFERIESMIRQTDIPLYAWHGDRSQTEKKKAIQHPKGVLQITPESLEALIMHHSNSIGRMFDQLQFIIIDEIHAFMGTDRGIQLQCLMNHLDRKLGRTVRRIGLSATIQNIEDAGRWLKAGSSLDVKIITSHAKGRKLLLAFRHDEFPVNSDDDIYTAIQKDRYQYLYNQVKGRKCLVFTNSRMESEETAVALSEIASNNQESDAFFVHHGSISASLRKETEDTLRASDKPATVITTKTLELGIDLGHLERVVQLGAPGSCSSFVQRLGRTGRRGSPAVMSFITENHPKGKDLFDDLPWEMLQNIAIIQLYLEERWVEPFSEKPCPYSVLLHQTLSFLMRKECSAKELAQYILSMPPFQHVSHQDYFLILQNMLKTDLIEKTETGTLIPGIKGEKIASYYSFYSVFADQSGYRIIFHHKTIGEIDRCPEADERLVLAGKSWIVKEVDADKRAVYVVPSSGEVKNQWSSGTMEIDDRIIQKIQSILLGPTDYPYLNQAARQALRNARESGKHFKFQNYYTITDPNAFIIHPWVGTRKMNTLFFILQDILNESLKIKRIQKSMSGTGIRVTTELSAKQFFDVLQSNIQEITEKELIAHVSKVPIDKYDIYLPEDLRQKAYIHNHLDIKGIQDLFSQSIC